MCDVCNEVREAFSLDWDNCLMCSSDNTNSVIGQRNSFLVKMSEVTEKFLTLAALVIYHICVLEREPRICKC